MATYSRTIYHSQNGRYYKYSDSWNGPDILDGDTASSLERGSQEFHDHLFKRNGTWYSQVKIEGRHLFEELSPGISGVTQADSAEYLDYLLEELKKLG
jgi:hypothetical protein